VIHLDNVLEFRVGDSGDGVGERRRKFQREADAFLTHETEVILFAEIWGEIERVQSVSVGIVFATDVQLFVFAEFAGSGKYAVVGSYIDRVRARSRVVRVSRRAVADHPSTPQSRSD